MSQHILHKVKNLSMRNASVLDFPPASITAGTVELKWAQSPCEAGERQLTEAKRVSAIGVRVGFAMWNQTGIAAGWAKCSQSSCAELVL